MPGDNLQLFEIRLARDASFDALREPTGVAWVSASTEDEARRLVKEALGDVPISEVERYEFSPSRVIAFERPS